MSVSFIEKKIKIMHPRWRGQYNWEQFGDIRISYYPILERLWGLYVNIYGDIIVEDGLGTSRIACHGCGGGKHGLLTARPHGALVVMTGLRVGFGTPGWQAGFIYMTLYMNNEPWAVLLTALLTDDQRSSCSFLVGNKPRWFVQHKCHY